MAVFSLSNIDAQTRPQQDKPLLLLVDDEEHNIKVLSYLLGEEFSLLTATSGVQALDIIEHAVQPHLIQLVISDQAMPNMSGMQLLEQIRVKLPDTVLMLLSGMVDVEKINAILKTAGIFELITKPLDPPMFLQTVRQGIAVYQGRQQLLAQRRELNLEIQVISEQLTEKKRILEQVKEALASHW